MCWPPSRLRHSVQFHVPSLRPGAIVYTFANVTITRGHSRHGGLPGICNGLRDVTLGVRLNNRFLLLRLVA
jgi:hypothetical protein